MLTRIMLVLPPRGRCTLAPGDAPASVRCAVGIVRAPSSRLASRDWKEPDESSPPGALGEPMTVTHEICRDQRREEEEQTEDEEQQPTVALAAGHTCWPER